MRGKGGAVADLGWPVQGSAGGTSHLLSRPDSGGPMGVASAARTSEPQARVRYGGLGWPEVPVPANRGGGSFATAAQGPPPRPGARRGWESAGMAESRGSASQQPSDVSRETGATEQFGNAAEEVASRSERRVGRGMAAGAGGPEQGGRVEHGSASVAGTDESGRTIEWHRAPEQQAPEQHQPAEPRRLRPEYPQGGPEYPQRAALAESESWPASPGIGPGYPQGERPYPQPPGPGAPELHQLGDVGDTARVAPRHGRPVGWYEPATREVAGGRREPVGPDGPPAGAAAWGTSAEQGIPSTRTIQGPDRPMIAGTHSDALSARAESEDVVAIPVARDTSADTPIARAAQAAMNARAAAEQWPRPGGCRILTIANQKGGVGKTTTAVNLAASLAMHGSRVLVVDLDPQGNASTALDVEHRSGSPSIYNVLVDGRPLADVVLPVQGFPQLYCAPATIDLAGAEIELVPLVAREARLSRAVAEYDYSNLDYLFIDCPPSLGLLTVNALVAAPEVLIPIQCEYYALEGLEQLLRTVELVRSHLNPNLAVTTILLTMFDSRTRLASQVAEEVRNHFGELVLNSVIPRSVRVSEAPSYGQSVMTYDPGSSGALAYLEAAREMAFQNRQVATA